jgi:hypothetical protein
VLTGLPETRRRWRRVLVSTAATRTVPVDGIGPVEVTVDYGRAYAGAIPMARFQLLPETGHSPQLETPDQVIRAIWDSADTDFSAFARWLALPITENTGITTMSKTAVTRVTHSCHLIEIGGRTLLTDPWFSTRPGYYQGEPIAAPRRRAALEFQARIPPSGIVTIVSGRQTVTLRQGPAGRVLTIWADLHSIHLILDGHVLRTVASQRCHYVAVSRAPLRLTYRY